jgi:hypothetical protein
MIRKLGWPALLLALSGCAFSSGFSRDLLQARLREDAQATVTDDEIKTIQSLKAQLRFPCRIAVALQADGGDWRWTFNDKKAMNGWADSLRHQGIASEVVFMSGRFSRGETLKELRAAAAKYGADALLVLKGTAATEDRHNPLAVLNVTVVGGFILPGSHRDALFVMEGVLVDVNNGFLYATAEAEGQGTTLGPTFVLEGKDAIERAKQEALASFGPELQRQFNSLRASAALAGPPVVLPPTPVPVGSVASAPDRRALTITPRVP